MVGRDRNATFSYIKDRVWQKINSWSSKCLSKSGREVMIKYVLHAIPSYVMSIFQLTTTLIDTIEKMMNSFWWGHGRTTQRGINWMSWERLSVAKVHGGMGFKDLSAFNLAMLGKHGWKFLTEPDSIVSRIFKARYFPSCNYLMTQIGHNLRFIVHGGAHWSIGPASSISILNQPWIANGECIDGGIVGAHFVQNFTVNSLMNLYDKSWNEEVIRQVFSVDIADKILHTPLIAHVQEDRLIWKAERHGRYSICSAYRLCVEELVDSSHLRRLGYWSGIWKLKIPPKVKNLGWHMCRGCLSTRVRLLDKGAQCPTNCVSCPLYEDLAHIFFNCPFAIQVWQITGLLGPIEHALSSTTLVTDTIFLLLETLSVEFNQRFGVFGSTKIFKFGMMLRR